MGRPNIVFIMTDQQRGDCLGIEGHPVLLTPTMDRIASSGVRFTRAYTTCPSCIAARRSLMVGQFPATHGVVGYQDKLEWDAPPTLPGVLREAGYQTAIIGRSMHLYPVRKRYGFEQMMIMDHKEGTGEYDQWLAEQRLPGRPAWFGGGVMHNDWTACPWPMEDRFHFTNWTVDQSLLYLQRRDPSCPLFLTVSFISPHPPLQPPAFYMERYLRTGVPEPVIGDWAEPPPDDGRGQDVAAQQVVLKGEALLSARAAYYGLINHIDDQLRRLLNPVTGIPGLLGPDTIVVFTADHGEMLGDHYLWRKQVPYEGSARIPMLIQAPASTGIKPGRTVDAPVCLEDLMPTLLDLTEVPVPETVEGRSLAPFLRGESPAWREYLHLEHAPYQQCVTDGREKFVWIPESGRELFFDLTNDPAECRNLAAEPEVAERVARWRGRLIERLKGRPEGFTDGERLIAGRPYKAALPHCHARSPGSGPR